MLFEAHGIELTEIQAQIPINQALTLLEPAAGPIDRTALNMETMRKVFNVEATVRLESGDVQVAWPARFDRVREQLDTQTRTVRIVVAVDKPYENIVPGKRPPLAPGMFCEVELRGQPRTGQVVVPRTALVNGHVYLINEENRLERRAVKMIKHFGVLEEFFFIDHVGKSCFGYEVIIPAHQLHLGAAGGWSRR